jgi:hypothetical protein
MSRSLPPLEYCFGTSPIQAEKLSADRKVLGSATLAETLARSSGAQRAPYFIAFPDRESALWKLARWFGGVPTGGSDLFGAMRAVPICFCT